MCVRALLNPSLSAPNHPYFSIVEATALLTSKVSLSLSLSLSLSPPQTIPTNVFKYLLSIVPVLALDLALNFEFDQINTLLVS
jgi:hypothetical protein